MFCKCRYVYIGIIIIEYERKHNHHHYILLRHEGIPEAMTPLIWLVLSNQQNYQLSKDFRVIAALLLHHSQNYVTGCRAPCTSTAVMILNIKWGVLIQKLYVVYCSLRTYTYLKIFVTFKYRTWAVKILNDIVGWMNSLLVNTSTLHYTKNESDTKCLYDPAPRIRVLGEKLIVYQFTENFIFLHGHQWFITMFRRPRYWPLIYSEPNKSSPHFPTVFIYYSF